MSKLSRTQLALLLSTSLFSLSSQALEPLSEEDIKPFCENTMIWNGTGISAQQCIKTGVSCSQKIAPNETDFGAATTKLVQCILKENGIEMPMYDEQ